VDLGVSLASVTPFLGEFTVYSRRRVAILSGESGHFTLQETARRVCAARGIELASLKDCLTWQFRLPQLANANHLDALRQGIERDRVEVLIIDPIYLCLMSCSASSEPSWVLSCTPCDVWLSGMAFPFSCAIR
jgi:hypothetical protein